MWIYLEKKEEDTDFELETTLLSGKKWQWQMNYVKWIFDIIHVVTWITELFKKIHYKCKRASIKKKTFFYSGKRDQEKVIDTTVNSVLGKM